MLLHLLIPVVFDCSQMIPPPQKIDMPAMSVLFAGVAALLLLRRADGKCFGAIGAADHNVPISQQLLTRRYTT